MIEPSHKTLASSEQNSLASSTHIATPTLAVRTILICSVVILSIGLRVPHLMTSTCFHPIAEVELAAISLAEEGQIAHVYGPDAGLSAHVSPLYPLFLSGLYRVFGSASPPARLAQGVCAIIATIGSFFLLLPVARLLCFSSTSAWIAILLLAVMPINLWYETAGDFEQPYASLTLLGLIAVSCAISNQEWKEMKTLVQCGILSGLAALLHAALLPFLGLMAFYEISRRDHRLQVAKGLLAIGLISALIILPWAIRNYYALGGIVLFRSNFGLELAIGNCPHANGKTYVTNPSDRDSPFFKNHPLHDDVDRARVINIGELRYMEEKKHAALDWIKNHPVDMAWLTLRRFQLYWFPTREMWMPNDTRWYLKLAVFNVVSVLAFFELMKLTLSCHRHAGIVWAGMIGPSLIYMITHVDPRYRYPTFAFSVLLAVEFVVSVVTPFVKLPKGADSASATNSFPNESKVPAK